ncbi:hypothetical protein IPJ70_04295 [Candidatus Campbellbacteria bacterium]|nr:MAG: hypothetical protein IPJ70_04295 [Candidatus Campbellbacteria bacterium]
MSKGIGRLIQFGIAKETVRGTPEVAASYWIPFSELDFNEKYNLVNDEQSRGVIEDTVGQSKSKEWSEGSVKAPIADKHFPLILFSVLGSLSTGDNADSDATVKDHIITVAQSSQHQALSLFVDDPLAAQDYKHGNGSISSLEIHYELNRFLDYTLGLKAKKGESAVLTPSSTPENRFLPQHLTFKLAASYSGLTAASAMNIRSLSLKIDHNLEDDDVLGSAAPADFLNKQFSIEGTLEATWNNETDFKTSALATTPKAMRIDLINNDVTIGNSAHPEIRIDLAKVIFKEITRPVKINDIVRQTLSFKAHYSLTDSLMISALATNLVASY